MTSLERRMYLALQGARTIVAATANVNPRAYRIKALIEQVSADYKAAEAKELPMDTEDAIAPGT